MKNKYFKKFSTMVLALFVVCGCFLAGCGSTTQTIGVDSIQISKKNVYLAEGETAVLSAQVYPFNANNQNVVWKSSDESVVKVEDGFITAIKKGEAVIEVLSEEGGYKDTCNILVAKASEHLALNNYNNLNMPPKELQPIYNGQNQSTTTASTKNATNRTTAAKIAKEMAIKAGAQVEDAKQSAKNVANQIKLELKNSINALSKQKQAITKQISNSAHSEFEDMFYNMQNEMIDSIKNTKQQILKQIEQTEEKIDSEEYTVQNKNLNGVTFVVISNNQNA